MLIKLGQMMKREENQKGFTLVELIVVMAILAILAAIAVPRFGATLTSSKKKAHNANVMMIEKAAEMAYINGENYTWDGNTDIMDDLVSDGYLDKKPEVPSGIGLSGDYKVTVKADSGDTVDKITITVTPGRI
ncbi:prepilin-type N-terminal cleavage/methylation domain-containing protein [Thermosyntropha sp.]|uniref:prepilin-type N-terminal cleavage/methylation domain-containing protein n=1 Tax=Thermosyntropha sp. TaxID=2740820 RepID=UPI0025DC747A|nr:prepilin-type N-terminal cleavage/methylation domain-containing protein [Thermosyntropha sp.]